MPNYHKVLIVFAISLYWLNAGAQDSNLLLSKVKNSSYLASITTEIIELNSVIYLVSIGKSKFADTSPQSLLNARTEAQMLAESGLTKFIYGTQVSSLESLTKKIKLTVVKEDGKIVSRDKNKTKNFLKIIKEHGEGVLSKVIRLGKWKVSNEYYFALAIKGK